MVFVFRIASATLSAGLLLATSAFPQQGPGTIKNLWKISQTQGTRGLRLDTNDQLGRSLAPLGDLDGNGVVDLASGAIGDDDGGIDQGAAHIFFLRSDGHALRIQKISELAGGFSGDLSEGDQLGRDLANLGDLDGDGVIDLAVGANYDDDGGPNRGAVWLLSLATDGTVTRTTKISQTQGGFGALLRNNDEFGRSVASLGDLDGDGVPDLAVGAPVDSTGGTKRGAVYVLFLRRDGSVKRHVKIAHGLGGFRGRLRNTDWFGFSLGNLGDFDGDGVTDLAVGAALDDDGAVNAGAVWLLYLRSDGTVKDHRKISMLSGGFTGELEYPDQFGTSVACVGDLNGDGVPEIAVGAVKDSDGAQEHGAVYVLFLTPQGTVAFHQKISSLQGGLPRVLNKWDWFGSSLAALGDFDRDGVPDLGVGARNDDDGGSNRGAFYLLALRGTPLAFTADVSAGQTPGTLVVERGDADGGPTRSAVVAETAYFGSGPEPEGNLELLAGDGSPGTELTFRLTAPEDFAREGALARLLVAARRAGDPLAAASTGFLLDRSAILLALEAVAAPGQRQVEITVHVPSEHAFRGAALSLQGIWRRGQQRSFTDAVELSLPE